jgi:hypothetical protein
VTEVYTLVKRAATDLKENKHFVTVLEAGAYTRPLFSST